MARAALVLAVPLLACGGSQQAPDAAPADVAIIVDLVPGPDLATCAADGDCSGARPRCDPASRRCVACLADHDNCPAGERCENPNGVWTCVAGCKVDSECGDAGAGVACCGGGCVDTTRSKSHCGKCFNPCINSDCCSGECVDTRSDVRDCGGCGMKCSVFHETPACRMSECVIASCDRGWADCDGAPFDGCEINTDADNSNCGACAMPCQNAMMCTLGRCH